MRIIATSDIVAASGSSRTANQTILAIHHVSFASGRKMSIFASTNGRIVGIFLSGLLAASGCGPSSDTGADESAEVLVGEQPLTINDVSVLFPLTDPDKLLHPEEAGAKGPLLPELLFSKAPPSRGVQPAQRYPHVRAVGVRFDPCFPKLVAAPDQCTPMLRIVWQSMRADGDKPESEDITFHSLHSLTSSEWDDVVNTLARLRAGTTKDYGAQPLTVHPAIADEGLDGPYATGLMALVRKYAGEQNLTRLAFMKLGGRGNEWTFGSFLNTNGELVEEPIATLDDTMTQTISGENFGSLQLNFSGGPAGEALESLVELPERRPSAAFKKGYDAALRIENPTSHSVETVDCVSCHVAGFLRTRAEPSMGSAARQNRNRYTAAGNLTSAHPPARGINLRAFGYFGTSPAISQRTVNESVAVASFINERLRAE